MGGNGGHGGGGLGGPSIGIAHALDLPPVTEQVTISRGLPGKGGLGGSEIWTFPGTEGADGAEGDMLGFPAP